jgi:hypothetical protein
MSRCSHCACRASLQELLVGAVHLKVPMQQCSRRYSSLSHRSAGPAGSAGSAGWQRRRLSTTAIRGAYACRFALRAIEQSSNRAIARMMSAGHSQRCLLGSILKKRCSSTLPLCHSASLWRGRAKTSLESWIQIFQPFLPPLHSHSGDLKRGMPAPAPTVCKYCPNDIGEPAPCKLLQNLLPLSLPAVLTLTE